MSSEKFVLSQTKPTFCVLSYCTVVNSVSNNYSQAKPPLCSSYLCPPLSSCFPFVVFSFFFCSEKEGVNLKSNLMCYVFELPEADG